jgi:hypothetical protein
MADRVADRQATALSGLYTAVGLVPATCQVRPVAAVAESLVLSAYNTNQWDQSVFRAVEMLVPVTGGGAEFESMQRLRLTFQTWRGPRREEPRTFDASSKN